MLAKLNTFALLGIDAIPVEVEVDNSQALMPKTVIVGLPEASVRESIHRIERALFNLDYAIPEGRTVINLAPADLRKDAGAFDLPIALGMLLATRQMVPEQSEEWATVGVLSVYGALRPGKGVLSMAMATRDRGLKKMIVPAENAREAAVVEEIEVYGVGTLNDAVGLITGRLDLEPAPFGLNDLSTRLNRYEVDFSDVRGQETAKRALMVAASGGHNLLMIGSPGTGKTMLARRLATILPPLTIPESLETTRIYSASGRLPAGEALLTCRPFRAPHHTISDAGMVGGGSIPAPGEISLAHFGVLFLDELPEFNRRALEVLRQPLEEGRVTISRALNSTTFPASFILVASMNPCPCGYLGDPKHVCKCTPMQIERYMARISGPLLDRIDLHIEVPVVPYQELSAKADGTSSAQMRAQVDQARAQQAQRFGPNGRTNSRMTPKELRTFCQLDSECSQLLQLAMEELGLSARAHDRILRVARTIADLEGVPNIQAHHLSEAIGYRSLDRRLWTK